METDHWNSNRPATRSIAAPGGQVEAIRSGADELDMGFPAELGKIRRRVPRLVGFDAWVVGGSGV